MTAKPPVISLPLDERAPCPKCDYYASATITETHVTTFCVNCGQSTRKEIKHASV